MTFHLPMYIIENEIYKFKNQKIMLLSSTIIRQLESKARHNISTAADCEYLSLDIESVTGEHIGVNTIKRLVGVIKDEREPRETTLNVIARYLGVKTWKELMSYEFFPASGFDTESDDFFSKDLEPGDRVRYGYKPDRQVIIKYLGDEKYEVQYSINSKLQKGDILTISQFEMNVPLFISNVERDGKSLGSYKAGKNGGLTELLILSW